MRKFGFVAAIALLAALPASAEAVTLNKVEITQATVNKAGNPRLVLVVNCSDAEFVQGESALVQKPKKGQPLVFDHVPGAVCTGTDQVRILNFVGGGYKPGKATFVWDLRLPGLGLIERKVVLHPVKG